MESLSHYPLLVFAVAFVALWLASAAGSWLRRNYPNADDEQNEHLGVILAATLTLLALIIGFSFSMSTNRYDQRKNFEEAEANAIGTELLRADFLPPADAANVRKLLGEYLDQRIQFYLNKDDVRRMRIDERTSQLQAAAGRFDFVPFDSRHRCSAAWLDRGQATEPGKLGEVARALKFDSNCGRPVKACPTIWRRNT
jgi:hypothetical protein